MKYKTQKTLTASYDETISLLKLWKSQARGKKLLKVYEKFFLFHNALWKKVQQIWNVENNFEVYFCE